MQTGLTEEQLALRRQGLGSSDIPAVAGLSRWRTPLDVWLDKTGRAPVVPTTAAMRRGIALEPVIGELYEERFGTNLERGTTVIDERRPWRLCTPDFLVIRDDKPFCVVEAKAPAFLTDDWGDDGTEEVPEDYAIQIQWQLDILYLDPADLAALIGNNFRVYHLRHDPEICGLLTEIGERFWHDHVLADKIPDVTASESDLAYLLMRFPRNESPLIDATTEIEELARHLFSAQAQKAEGEAAFKEYRNKLIALIGNADGVKGDGWKITWKKSKDSEKTDWKAIALALNASQELINTHTTIKEGSRRFLPSQKGG